ncbi:hypothetical protein [Burkholderia sp. Ac-20365]|uniref:hypothetical protein n=1 Tax=Burkholderia sp. Ac-20365 TaxID=2703897 RepID=UPI00197C3493|nr:hypothetical protein [Burkholderia sp. Ac-20365]MBN3764947.1 hypothetical protein [Burkholderia sp. Ac-20365]
MPATTQANQTKRRKTNQKQMPPRTGATPEAGKTNPGCHLNSKDKRQKTKNKIKSKKQKKADRFRSRPEGFWRAPIAVPEPEGPASMVPILGTDS